MTRPYKFGWVRDRRDSRDHHFSLTFRVPVSLPPRADLRAGCSPIEDQAKLGSCTAQALVGALEFLEIRAGFHFVDLSRLLLYYDERAAEGTVATDSGAQLRTGIKVLASKGVCRESLWPYFIDKFADKPMDACYTEAAQHTILAYQRLDTLADMKACLAVGLPFTFGFTVYRSALADAVAESGNIPLPSLWDRIRGSIGGHAVLAVGYEDATGKLLFRNSWGSAWGCDGYGTLPYEYFAGNLWGDAWCIQRTQSDFYATNQFSNGVVTV